MRRFRIDRMQDLTGVSGTGCVAQGVVFSDGTTVVRWLGKSPTTTVHPSIESVEAIHLHGGASKLRWEDPICFACGVEIDRNAYGQWCSACGATSDKPFLETRPDPSLGRWVPAMTIGGPAADPVLAPAPQPEARPVLPTLPGKDGE
jgi:hypothetical protein